MSLRSIIGYAVVQQGESDHEAESDEIDGEYQIDANEAEGISGDSHPFHYTLDNHEDGTDSHQDSMDEDQDIIHMDRDSTDSYHDELNSQHDELESVQGDADADLSVSNHTKDDVDDPHHVDNAQLSLFASRQVRGWPNDPIKLMQVPLSKVIREILLVLLPIPFTALAISAYAQDGEELSSNGRFVMSAAQLGPSIYPLVFAGVGGRCFRNWVLWKAQMGSRLDALERLAGCQSLVSTITSIFALRSIDILSLFILFFWLLSPLGGQSSLRLLHETDVKLSYTSNVTYASPDIPFLLAAGKAERMDMPKVLIAAGLVTAEAFSNVSVDLWGHAKVPQISTIELNKAWKNDRTEDWIQARNSPAYTSWIGVDVRSLTAGYQARFSFEYSYIDLRCNRLFHATPQDTLAYMGNSSIRIMPPFNFQNSSLKGGAAVNVLLEKKILQAQKDDSKAQNENKDTWIALQTGSTFFKYAFERSDTNSSTTNSSVQNQENERKPSYFLFGGFSPGDASRDVTSLFYTFKCVPELIRLEVQVECDTNGRCEADRIRRIPQEKDPEKWVCPILDQEPSRPKACLLVHSDTLRTFMELWYTILSTGSSSANQFEAFLSHGSKRSYSNAALPWKQVTDDALSARLSILINTYWHAATWGSWTTEMEQATTFSPFAEPKAMQSAQRVVLYNRTVATKERTIRVYRASKTWIAVLICTNTVLIVLSVLNVAVACTTLAPDVFGYVSSITRGLHVHNTEIQGPVENHQQALFNSGTALDGAKRARLLKNMRLRIEDVKPKEKIGAIAINVYSEDDRHKSREAGALAYGRLYE